MPTYESLPTEPKYFNGILFQKMAEDLRLDGKSKRTVYGYLRAVRQLADFCQNRPDELNEQDLRRYLLHLIVELEVATGTQTVALSGIKFFFRITYAAHLLEAGVSLRAIRKCLGYSSLQTTLVYLHLTETAEFDNRKVINQLFGPSAINGNPASSAAPVDRIVRLLVAAKS